MVPSRKRRESDVLKDVVQNVYTLSQLAIEFLKLLISSAIELKSLLRIWQASCKKFVNQAVPCIQTGGQGLDHSRMLPVELCNLSK